MLRLLLPHNLLELCRFIMFLEFFLQSVCHKYLSIGESVGVSFGLRLVSLIILIP